MKLKDEQSLRLDHRQLAGDRIRPGRRRHRQRRNTLLKKIEEETNRTAYARGNTIANV